MDVNTILRFMVLVQDTNPNKKEMGKDIFLFIYFLFLLSSYLCPMALHYWRIVLQRKPTTKVPLQSRFGTACMFHGCISGFRFCLDNNFEEFFFFALFPDCLFFVWCRTKMRMLCFLELSSVRIRSLQFHLMQWRMGLHIHFMQGKVTWACFSGLKYIAQKCTLL